MKGLELTTENVATYLSRHFATEIDGVVPLTGGGWSQAFGFRADGRDLVVRFGEHVDDFEKDRAAHPYSSPAMPVPEVFEIGSGLDRHFCISQRIFGGMIDDLDAARMRRIVPAVVRVWDALRAAHVNKWIAAVGAPTTGWREQLLSVDEENDRVFGWHDRIAATPAAALAYSQGLRYLRSRVPSCPEDLHLLHNDLLHHNVLVRDDAIVGVIDWGCAGLGDFLYELALFTFYAPWYPMMEGIDWRAAALRHYEAIGLDVPDFDARLRCYEVHIGLSGMAYTAFRESWSSLAEHASRTMELLV